MKKEKEKENFVTRDIQEIIENEGKEIAKKEGILNFLPNLESCKDIEEIELKDVFLPYIFVNEDDKGRYFAKIKKGNTEKILPSGWGIKHIVAREFCRQLVGKKYENRCFLGQDEKKNKAFLDAKEKAENGINGWQKGLVHLIYIFFKDEKSQEMLCTLATLETVKAGEAYWLNLLKESKKEGGYAEIEIEDHKENLVKSKSTGNFYLSGYKFTQWYSRPLDQKLVSLMQETAEKQREAVLNFMAQ